MTLIWSDIIFSTNVVNEMNENKMSTFSSGQQLLSRSIASRFVAIVITSSLLMNEIPAAEPLVQRTETFSTDPNWEEFQNRRLPKELPTVKQDFGYQTSNHAGGTSPGEIGGRVQRSTTPAAYYLPTEPLSLEVPFSASGRFSVRNCEGGSGVMIGWFHDSSRGWRTPNSFAFRIDGNGNKYWVFYEYGTTHGMTGGAGAFDGERYQTTKTLPFAADDTSHRFHLAYDPQAADGNGAMTLQIDDTHYPPVPFPPGQRRDGIQLNRFGIWNVEIAGSHTEVYLDDLEINGKSYSFDQDPQWADVGSHVEFTDRIIRPLHDYGFSTTRQIGNEPGELAGVIFRDELPSFYATPVGKLSLDDPLHASGKIIMQSAAADSGFFIGWFDAEAKRNKQTPEHDQRSTNYLAALIEGPSRIGHYFRAAYSTSRGQGIVDAEGVPGMGQLSVIHPDHQIHEWELNYDPLAADGLGEIEVIFDGQRRTFPLHAGDRQTGAMFDHFGLFNLQAGGHHVQFVIDDLSYTSRGEK